MVFQPELIQSFIQSDLGCTCPDEVFNCIKQKVNEKIDPELEVDLVLTIGDRLLVFIKILNKKPKLEEMIEKLISCGKSWRDDYELNRFRLVVITSRIKSMKPKIEKIFKKSKSVDEKVHLHILDKKVLKQKKFKFLAEC